MVGVEWGGLGWLSGEGMGFEMMGFVGGVDWGKKGERSVMIGN